MKRSIIAIVMLSVGTIAWADGGNFLFVYGQVHVQNSDGERVVVQKGDAVASGDLVITSASGRAQIRMDDGGLLALRPNT
ncbi:MAG: iron dicitrate transport regulator FecR, partial [Gammaproteobacteria bacterium]|nr:iron dicitrate transport regulator FecR [Gammaproteobacteria bacterium]